MKKHLKNIFNSIATITLVAMLFSCTNDAKKIRDLLTDKNLPISIGKNVYHVYKDSGRITSKLITPLLHDFSNRKEHPYNEFPKGVKIISIDKNGLDSTTITGNYAISYKKTSISEIAGNVVVLNHSEKSKLETDQLFWDQKEGYYFTEEKFRFTRETDTITGIGFESQEGLKKWLAKNTEGDLKTTKN